MSPDDGALAPSNDDEAATVADPASAEDPLLRRRTFLRKMTLDAVSAGARLAGNARIIQRSAAAASETLFRELDARPVASQGSVTAGDQPTLSESSGATQRSDAPSTPQFQASRAREPWPSPLTSGQEALLASAVPAAFATVQQGDAPQLTASPFHWDGGVFRISALDWTSRTLNVQVDPRVSLLIVDPGGGPSLSVTGSAVVIAGPSARDETLPILRKYAVDEPDAAARWTELNANGDRIVIVVVPERMLWWSDELPWGSRGSSDARTS